MRPKIEPVFNVLAEGIDKKVRDSMLRRYEAMERELTYLAGKDDRNLSFIRARNWTDDRLLVLFVLNCFYQQVVGPLQSSARGGVAKLGTDIPIKHGSMIYDGARSKKINSAVNDFFKLSFGLKYERAWMTKNTASDVVFYVARFEREAHGERDGN